MPSTTRARHPPSADPYVRRPKTLSSGALKRKSTVAPPNSIPTPPTPLGSSANLWLWGDADLNRLGKCPFELGLYKPTKNSWLKMKDGVILGGEGIKLVAIAAGGIRSVVLDEEGAVCLHFLSSMYLRSLTHARSYGLGARKITALSDGLFQTSTRKLFRPHCRAWSMRTFESSSVLLVIISAPH
jgi:hypothetical protein